MSTSVTPKSNSIHTRTRAGCLTCRRRKKKCDERKPRCMACTRNQLACSWPAHVDRRSISQVPVNDSESGHRPDPAHAELSKNTNGSAPADDPTIVHWTPRLKTFNSLKRAGMFLPESNSLLSHYLARTGSLLATAPTGANPFLSSVVAIACNDDLVMHCVLALSGSHLGFTLGDDSGNEIHRATYKHYALALRTLQYAVGSSVAGEDPVATMKVLLSMMLLCHYEAISGNLTGSMFAHLRASRALILQLRSHHCRQQIQSTDSKMLYGLILEIYSYIVLANSITPYGMIQSRTIACDPFLLSLDGELGEFEGFGTMFGGSYELFKMLMHVSVYAAQEANGELDHTNFDLERQKKYALLKSRVLQWAPPALPSQTPDFLAQRAAVLEVFRYSVLIYLETMPRLVRRDDETQMRKIQTLTDIAIAYSQQKSARAPQRSPLAQQVQYAEHRSGTRASQLAMGG
ncbi:fungal-specific transcription factor domain-containing protein [Aspergillus granulosus]|uniref:Fungal-specific transcription factor domain-containing protein n=1 Tax=Aspergillus granulosus TaxID=176169 RepID=A0ABR4I5I2_9EURO